MVVHCWLCYKVAAPTLKGIVKHMGNIHSHESNFFVKCGINSCTRSYTKFYSFKKHLYRKHRRELGCSALSRSIEPRIEDEEIYHYNDYDNETVSPESECETTEYHNKTAAALFLLKTKEIHKVSQTALDGIIQDISSFIEVITKSMERDIRHCLENNSSISVDSSLSDVFLKYTSLNPFQGLHSKYLQEKYYHDFFGLLVCA